MSLLTRKRSKPGKEVEEGSTEIDRRRRIMSVMSFLTRKRASHEKEAEEGSTEMDRRHRIKESAGSRVGVTTVKKPTKHGQWRSRKMWRMSCILFWRRLSEREMKSNKRRRK